MAQNQYTYEPPTNQVEQAPLILHGGYSDIPNDTTNIYASPQQTPMPVYTENDPNNQINYPNPPIQQYIPPNQQYPPQQNYPNYPQQQYQQYPNYQQPLPNPVSQPQQIQQTPIGDHPCQMYCTNCDETVLSQIEYENGAFVYLLCCLMCCFGFLCLALIPCCLNGVKDINHRWFVFIISYFNINI